MQKRARPPRRRRVKDRGEPFTLFVVNSFQFVFSRKVYSLSWGVSKLPSNRKFDFPRVGRAIPNRGERTTSHVGMRFRCR
jgi:hypothetical protein